MHYNCMHRAQVFVKENVCISDGPGTFCADRLPIGISKGVLRVPEHLHHLSLR